MCLDAIAEYYPIYRNNAPAMLIFDVFSTFLEFNAPIKQRRAQNLCEYLKCYIDFSFTQIK